MKKLLAFLLTLSLLCASALAEAPAEYLGKPLKDFTVQTIDGGTFTLSEALKDHDMVLINLWASWCGPCAMEFPYLEEAYARYSDRVAVIALSIEPTDTPEVLKSFAQEHGMTFPVGSDTQTGLADTFSVMYIPTSVVVDRFGNVALAENGTQTGTARFTALFDYFLSDDYTATTVLDAFPMPKPVDAADTAALAVGGEFDFRNPEDESIWPMLPTEDGGKSALVSTNAGIDESTAAVCATVTAAEGEALAFDFKTSLEPAMDALFIQVDGEIVKQFTGEHDWTGWAIPLSAGTHEIVLGCIKDQANAEGEDKVWVSNVRLIPGVEAEGIVHVLPASDSFSAVLADPDARTIEFDDPDGIVAYYFGTDRGWIVGDEAALDITLSAAEDPETAYVYDMTGVHGLSGTEKPDGSGYQVRVPLETDGYNSVLVYPGNSDEQLNSPEALLLFNGEAGADAFAAYLRKNGIDIGWHYAE